MRQVIKGDGSDGTAALKAYLLAHDDVLSQELYEFIKPAIGASPAPVPAATSATSLTSASTVTPDSTPHGYGTIPSRTGNSVEIDRQTSRPWWAFNDPGIVTFTTATDLYGAPGSDSLLAPPRSSIVKVYAVLTANLVSGIESGGSHFAFAPTLQVSTNGGSGFSSFSLPIVDAPAQEFTIDITSLLGSIATFDFNQIQFQAFFRTGIFEDLLAPGCKLVVSGVGLRFTYSTTPVTTPSSTPIAKVCDASSPLTYAGNVYAPAVIKNNGFKSKIGLSVDSLQIEWTLRGDEALVTDPDSGATILTYLQGFQQGLFAGVWVRWRRAYMPTFGDCDSLGAVKGFRGRIGPVEMDRLTAKITVNSITELFNRQVPQQLIEANNRSLQVGPGLPPDLDPNPELWTYFEAVAGHDGTVQKIVAVQTNPVPDQVYAPGTFDLGYLWFQASPLKDFIAQVQHYEVIAGFNVFYLFRPLYVDPHPGGLRFAAFVPVPKDQTISGASGIELPGFRFVPLPEQAV